MPFHFRVSATSNNKYTLTMSLQNGTIVTRKEELAKMKKIDSYSKASFDYRFCIENLDAVADSFHINFHEGIEVTHRSISARRSLATAQNGGCAIRGGAGAGDQGYTYKTAGAAGREQEHQLA